MKLSYKEKILPLLLVFTFTILAFQPEKLQVSAHPLAAKGGDAYTVIALVNEVRAAYGLAAYNANPALMNSAQAHSNYQASIGTLTHSGNGGSRAGDRAVAAGYGGGAKVYVTENIYGGRSASPSVAVNWWQGDATHLNTMISPSYTDVGVGVAEGNGVIYYTMDVGYVAGSAGSGSASQNTTSGNTSSDTSNASGSAIIPVMAATPQADGSIIHTVKDGQALWNIAAIYNISVTDLLTLNGLTENSFIHPGDELKVRSATTITATQMVTATDTITLSTPTVPISITNPISSTTSNPVISTATAVMAIMDTPTLSTQPADANEPQPTIIVVLNSDANNATTGKKFDPVLLAIGGLVVVGMFLVVLGSVTRKAS